MESVARLAQNLDAALTDVREEIEHLRNELVRVQGVISLQLEREQRLVQMQKVLTEGGVLWETSLKPRTQSNGGESGNGQISDERIQTILAALEEPSTARELHQRTGIPQSTVSSALTRMHKQGLVMKTGVRKQKAGLSPAVWALPWESPS